MKKVRVEDAVGLTLCHDITQMIDGFKGPRFKRGHVVCEEDIEVLKDLGKQTVFIWEENAGELHEEDCALRMSAAGTDENMTKEGPSEGKIVVRSSVRGMFRVDTELLNRLNHIPDVTVATIPDHYPVEEGSRLASMRIVPLVTKEENIIEFENLCKDRRLMQVLPYRDMKIGVIITGSEVYSGRIKDKFEPVVRAKMEKYPSEILGISICDDNTGMIRDAAKSYIDEGADLLIFTGGMSVDPDDVTPTAIRMLGADIITHGVPSQPGNMTLMAYLDDIAIMGVPGAAISLPTTVFDVLLPQIFTGSRITAEDLIRLGDGGLCQQCKPCHYPNCTFGRY